MNKPNASLAPLGTLMTTIDLVLGNLNFKDMSGVASFDDSAVPSTLEDFTGHIYLTLPWLWVNIGFLYMLNRKVKYEWVKPCKLGKLMNKFKNENRTGRWRGGLDNLVEVQMFPVGSKTLFARLCIQNVPVTATVEIDPAFEAFLLETCGWQGCNLAQSPAMFFRLLGVSNVKTGCLISSNMLKIPNPRFESIKKSFPLNAQVEIEYAVEALAATIYHTAP